MNKPTYDAIIIGGGLHGLSTALHLARAGLKPLVLEKDYSGRHASGVNAGGVRRLGRHLAEIPLAVESLKLWQQMAALVDDDCGFSACGQIKVAETEAELASLKARVDALQRQGFSHEQLIPAAELNALVPALSGRCYGAIWCEDDGAANPFRTVQAFRRKAVALGATVEYGAVVSAIKRLHNHWQVTSGKGDFAAPVLINTAGAWGNQICKLIGDFAPVTPQALMLMITERVAPFLKPVLGAEGRMLSFKQFDNGTVLIGGGYVGQALPERNLALDKLTGLRLSAQTVSALFPQLSSVNVMRFWAGIEGMMPDGIPVIGPSQAADNAYHAFGFCGHGFQLGPIVGKLITELVTEGRSSIPIEAFRIGRFNVTDDSER